MTNDESIYHYRKERKSFSTVPFASQSLIQKRLSKCHPLPFPPRYGKQDRMLQTDLQIQSSSTLSWHIHWTTNWPILSWNVSVHPRGNYKRENFGVARAKYLHWVPHLGRMRISTGPNNAVRQHYSMSICRNRFGTISCTRNSISCFRLASIPRGGTHHVRTICF